MFTYKILLRPGQNSVRLRLTNKRKVAEISLGIFLDAENFADVMSARPKAVNMKWKSLIASLTARLDEYRCELLKSGESDMDVKKIRDKVLRDFFSKDIPDEAEKPEGSFIRHFIAFADSKTNSGTRGVYLHTLNRIRLFDPEVEKKEFEEIDLRWLTRFEAFCARTAGKNARNIHLRNIRAVFNNAINYELTSAYPFRRFKIRPEPTRKRSLPVEDLRRLFDFPVEPYAEIYRDMFKLIFLLIGINTVDLHGLRRLTRDGRIEYRRAKTGRLYSIKVEPEALEIIERYRGVSGLLTIADRWSDHRNFTHQCNKALQRFGTLERKGRGGKKIIEPEFPGLTTYWARHSWATVAYSIGISKDIIAQALGHSDGHDTTNIYIREDTAKVDEANRRVIDWVLYGGK